MYSAGCSGGELVMVTVTVVVIILKVMVDMVVEMLVVMMLMVLEAAVATVVAAVVFVVLTMVVVTATVMIVAVFIVLANRGGSRGFYSCGGDSRGGYGGCGCGGGSGSSGGIDIGKMEVVDYKVVAICRRVLPHGNVDLCFHIKEPHKFSE